MEFTQKGSKKTESELLKNIIKEVVYGNHASAILEHMRSHKVNFPRLKNLLIYHELANFLYVIVNKFGADLKELSSLLKNIYYLQLGHYLRLYSEFIMALTESKKRGFMMIPIKGFSYPENYYKRYGFRPLVDVDLLIKKSDFERGVNLLEDLGYKKHLLGATEEYWRKKQCHVEFVKEQDAYKIILELHWALDFERGKQEILPALWNRLHKTSFQNHEFYIMSPEDTLISLALHQRRFGKALNLKYVCDIGILLNKECLDWEYVIETAYEGRFRASLFFILAQTQIALDKNLSQYLDALRIPFWQRKSIFTIIKKYTYGSPQDFSLSYLYLLCHFLFYDSLGESLLYVLKIPQEQFAKFYGLPLYDKQTKWRYRIRIVYVFYRLIKDNLLKTLVHK